MEFKGVFLPNYNPALIEFNFSCPDPLFGSDSFTVRD